MYNTILNNIITQHDSITNCTLDRPGSIDLLNNNSQSIIKVLKNWNGSFKQNWVNLSDWNYR